MSIQLLRQALERKKGERKRVRTDLKGYRQEVRRLVTEVQNVEKARLIIQRAAQMTQEQLQYHISEITSLALAAVFDDPYKLGVEFVQRRNKTECDLFFIEKWTEGRFDPLSATGGGSVDVSAFALRVALWSLQRPRTRNVLILDEPFRFLSTGLMSKASIMLKEIADRLTLQIIMVTHEKKLIECADRVFRVRQKKGISKIKMIS